MQRINNLSYSAIDKFVSENGGECIDFANGNLLDNVVYSFPFGTMFCFESFRNVWASSYDCLFFHKDRERGINKAWERFNSLKA